jgi:hypothetical protein
MIDPEKCSLDPNKQTLYFTGPCPDAIAACRAVCCRGWHVLIDKDEEASGRFATDVICLCGQGLCTDMKKTCINRRTRLNKKPDGSCVYLDGQNRCSIYETRPAACRTFTCGNGWKLVPAGSGARPDISRPDAVSGAFREQLDKNMLFAGNPALELKTSFCSHEDREIILVMKRPDKCGIVSFKAGYENPAVNDDVIAFMMQSFDGSKNLEAIHQAVNARFGIRLGNPEFMDLVLLFWTANLILFRMPVS